MKLLITLFTSTLLLTGCLASAPTYEDIKNARVEKLSDGALPQCEVAFGSNTSKWNQCISETPTRYNDDSKSTYKGSWIGGKPNGNGEFSYAGGGSYKGETKNAWRHGRGKSVYTNGDIYEGDFDVGGRRGLGRFELVNGETYRGQVDRTPKGAGVQTTKQGTSVEGNFSGWGSGRGDVKVTFKDGHVWTGSHNNLWRIGRKTAGKIKTPNGEIIDAEIEAIKTASCPTNSIKSCNVEFKFTITGLVGCAEFKGKEPSYSATGLPRQAGPIFLGMSVKNFECVLSTKLRDLTSEAGIARGVTRAFGGPMIVTERVGNLNLQHATAALYSTTVEVANLFSIPTWMRKPDSKTGKVFGGEISAIFMEDKLVLLKIGQPSAPASYLIKKYGKAKFNSKTVREKCVLGNKVVSQSPHFFTTWSWRDTNVVMQYETGTGLEGGNIDSGNSNWLFGSAKPPSCSANVQPKNVYSLIDAVAFRTITQAVDADKRIQQKEAEKIYKGF